MIGLRGAVLRASLQALFPLSRGGCSLLSRYGMPCAEKGSTKTPRHALTPRFCRPRSSLPARSRHALAPALPRICRPRPHQDTLPELSRLVCRIGFRSTTASADGVSSPLSAQVQAPEVGR